MAIVIPLQRRRGPEVAVNKYSSEAFWRKSMVPASIGMGVIIVTAVATLGIGVKMGWLGHDSSQWVLVAALVSVIGLTKIVIANMALRRAAILRAGIKVRSIPLATRNRWPSTKPSFLNEPPM